MSSPEDMVSVRYMVDYVQAAIDFYTGHLCFTVRTSAAPAFADVTRGNLRLLLAGPRSSAGRPMPDGRKPEPGGWNRIDFIVPDITARSPGCVPRACISATTSSRGLAATRS